MPSLTPRATVIVALAEREAELLGHGRTPTTGHALIAILWEGKGVAADALRKLGLNGGHAEIVRERLRDLPSEARGRPILGLGLGEAGELGHDYIGTEHQLLAITNDDSLDARVLDRNTRRRARGRVLAIVESDGYSAPSAEPGGDS